MKIGITQKLKNCNLNKRDILMTILFVLCFLSFYWGIMSVTWVCAYLKVPNILKLKYHWISWFFLPIPLLSIYFGKKYLKQNQKYKKNIVAGKIIFILLLLFGFAMFFPVGETDYNKMLEYDTIIPNELPKTGTLVLEQYDSYFNKNMHNVTLYSAYYKGNEENLKEFENSIKNSDLWINIKNLSSSLQSFIDPFISKDEVYYLIYNADLKEYNKIPPETGTYHIYSISYNFKDKSLEMIESDFDYKS